MNQISGVSEFETKKSENEVSYFLGEKVFLIEHLDSHNEIRTIEIRTDKNLKDLLKEKYESVMESRYFGHGGIEIVMSGQFSSPEIDDLIRLSYNLTKEIEN